MDEYCFDETQQVICLNDTFTPIEKESVFLFTDHTTHTTRLRHRADCAAMDMEISVTGSIHTWQCFLCCDALYIQWRMEFPGDSPRVTGNRRQIWFEYDEPGASCAR